VRALILADAGATAASILLILILVIVLAVLLRSIRVIQQGTLGVVKRLGQFHSIRQPGVTMVVPIIDKLVPVDVREQPWVGAHQNVITKDNVSILVNATIFTQVTDVRKALFEVSDYKSAINNVAEASLRSVIGNMTLDEVLTGRDKINAELQGHVAPLTEKWGVHLNRVEVIDIVPPQSILEAMAMQKEADQKKRALILQSEGEQIAAINTAKGKRDAAIATAEGEKQAAILQAEGKKQAQILLAEAAREVASLEAEGRARAIQLIYDAIHKGSPTPDVLAVLQLETLGKLASSDNAKLVVPVESAGLLGAAEVLRDLLARNRPDSEPRASPAGDSASTGGPPATATGAQGTSP
jgi:regulator of protease activity HflC (stomatin/prohibitin superfamily)